MPLDFHSVTFESPDPERDARFWGAVLGRPAESDAGGILLAGSDGQVGLRFCEGPPARTARNRLHLHLSEVPGRQQADTIRTCESLGARLRGNGHVPANGYAAMADPLGDDFCVIEDGNGYLDGCGPLGEVTCEGTPTVGEFWSEALGWPLVWEVGDERVIQPPAGGTKIAWGGEPAAPQIDTGRQYFVFTVIDREFDREVARLVELGATATGDRGAGGIELRDPDGVAFILRALHGDE